MGFAAGTLNRDTVVLLDKLCHACLIDSVRFSGAHMRVFRHNDISMLEDRLAWARKKFPPETPILIMTESIFSMDGDPAPLPEIVALKEKYGAALLVDEAHAIGCMGPRGAGLSAELGLTERIDFHMGTLSKAVGVSGGYLAGSQRFIDALINRARSFIYTTAPPPSQAMTAKASLDLITGSEGDRRRGCLWRNIHRLASHLNIASPASAILPYIIGEEEKVLKFSKQLRTQGFFLPAIRYPTVARGTARLRITISANHTEAQIDALAAAMLHSS